MKKSFLPCLLLLAILCACATRPLKGGRTKFLGSGPASATMETSQGENPQTPTSSEYEKTRETSVDLPAGSTVEEFSVPQGQTNAARKSIVLAAPSRQVVKEVERTKTSMGAAQKDTARELGAKMKAAAPLLFIGIMCLLGGGAFAYFAWYTPAIIAGVTGIIFLCLYFMLPSITPMMWLFIALGLLGAAAVTLIVFHAYNSGHKDGKQDVNKNGIDDREEEALKKKLGPVAYAAYERGMKAMAKAQGTNPS